MTPTTDVILFDLFATLISVTKAANGRGRHTADILGIDRDRWNRACFGEHHEICRPTRQHEVIRRLARSIDPGIPDHRIREASEERQWRFDNALLEIEPGITTVLERLRGEGLRLGLVSNASTDEVRAWSDSPLRPLFDTALFSCERGVQKPSPAIYAMALEELEARPEAALFVGDGGSREHRGAADAGIRSLLVTYFLEGLGEEDLAARADGAVGTIGHIEELLDPGLGVTRGAS